MAATANAAERRDALVERLFMDAIGAFDLISVYLGDVLGLYRTLADKGPLILAQATGGSCLGARNPSFGGCLKCGDRCCP